MDTNNTTTDIIKVENNKTGRTAPEIRFLLGLTVIFALVLIGAWGFALKLQHTVAVNNNASPADAGAVIKIERLRNLTASQIDNARTFFLLGSQSLFEKQKEGRRELLADLDQFEKEHNLAGVSVQLKRVRDQFQKAQDFFEQGMDFREKKTESKIVGQFYQSKTTPLRSEINEAFDEIVRIHQTELHRSLAQAHTAAVEAESQIPLGMTWLTGLMAGIFLGLAFLVLRLVRKQGFIVEQQNRLYAEAKKAIQDRDDALFAISHDLKDSLHLIANTGDQIQTRTNDPELIQSGELVKSTVAVIEGLIQDIRDKKSVEMEGLTLRMDQLPIDSVLESAKSLMAPLAKQRDIRLQIDKVNPPVLAFYDNDRTLRVLANLIGNAIKFSPQGEKVVVKVRSDQKFVNISVIDSGAGIPAAQLDGIFENFWQAQKTANQGAGVGLAIAKTIVEAHGGNIEVQSQAGRGTTVTFSLPRRRPVGAAMNKPTVMVRQHGATPEWHL